ncbi:YcjF family protein [Rubidibacter lacunae]|nr:GTP-binding protein [Rubidibacter lacunae]
MSSPRAIAFIVGLCFVLGLAIWLIGAIYQLYVEVSFSSLLLANLLLLVVLVLLGLLVAAFVYYFNQIFKPSQRSRRPVVRAPEKKAEAAGVTLKAVRQQVGQIQDEVARQALWERSRAIEANLQRQDLHVVVFGTGSAGKTSLINALIGRVVGTVGAPMGTTQAGATYALPLPRLRRQIFITDTPGILEAGVAGTERERLAKQLATEADLLVFVVDNDLRQSEFEPLQVLAAIGKRSLLVLNKTDLYAQPDREAVLASLRARVRGFIAPQDVVDAAAAPQPMQLANGQFVQPDADIEATIRRLAEVLRSEGEELVADNILLQAQRLGQDVRESLDRQRRQQAEQIVERYQWISAGVLAVTPLPVADMLGAAAVNAQMVVELGRIYGCELNLDRGRELALSLGKMLVSLGVVKGALQLLATALQLSVAGYLVGKAIQGVTVAYLTRIAGKSFIEYFRQNQDWGDGGMGEVVQRQFRLERRDEFVKAFVSEAIDRVVKPLTVAKRSPEDAEELMSPAENDAPSPELISELLVHDDWERSPQSDRDW